MSDNKELKIKIKQNIKNKRGKKMYKDQTQIHQIRGRVCNEPQLKTTTTGKKLLTFTLAYQTSQTTDQEGSHSNFIQVDAWEKTATIFHPLLHKGLQIIVNGSLLQNRWKDKDDNFRSNFKLVADTLLITDLKFKGSINTEQEKRKPVHAA